MQFYCVIDDSMFLMLTSNLNEYENVKTDITLDGDPAMIRNFGQNLAETARAQ